MNHYNCIYMYISPSGKIYIGKTKDFFKREKIHLSNSYNKNARDYNVPFHCAIRKYGIENFKVKILKENISSSCSLGLLEDYYIEKFDSYANHGKGYNVAKGGTGGNTLIGMTEKELNEWKIKNSERWHNMTEEERKEYGKKISERWCNMTDEERKKYSEKMSGENNPFYNKHHTEETKQKISEKNKGRKHTKEELNKMSESQKKRWDNMSEEEKKEFGKKIRERQMGENNPMYGKHHTEETKQKLSKNNRCKKVAQYDMDGNFIKTFNSIAEAQKTVGIKSGIRLCCQGKIKQAGGYKWKFIIKGSDRQCFQEQ